MISPVNIALPELSEMTPETIQRLLRHFAPASGTDRERVRAIEQALNSPAGELVRREMGRWIVEQVVPVEVLVPEFYARWREPVREAMLFVVARLSAARLAPKILEQVQLPPDTPAEERLLLLISKVPGLQKLGQVIARNRNLSPALREALSQLENGIRDVDVKDVCAEVRRELGTRLEQFEVEITPALLSEASVSAIVRFTWRNPVGGKRERGVFKVLKPHVPVFFAEDMEILQGLAAHFGGRHGKYGFAAHVLTDTFTKVRRLLEHEVDFPREQATLLGKCADYRAIPGVRVPTLISPLCTANVTAMTEEPGGKVTDATAGLPAWRRRRVAEQLTEAVLAAPLLSEQKDALFHADPHAGNLLYDSRLGEVTLLDWALTERLSREQRRHLAVLVIMTGLRDPVGVTSEIYALSQHGLKDRKNYSAKIRTLVREYLDELPVTQLPDAVHAMRLVERVAISGVRFPAPLIMFSKAVFTLEGILREIGGPDVSIGALMGMAVAHRWLTMRSAVGTPLRATDWIRVQVSGLLFIGRIWIRGEQSLMNLLLSPAAAQSNTQQQLKGNEI